MKKSDFEKQKGASLAHQLIKAGRLINERGLAAARDAFHLPELKQSHLDLFPYIDFEGTGISEMAKRKGVSKQSVSKLVQEMVHMNILFLKIDLKDSRSKRVFFNTSGSFAIQKGFAALMSIDHMLIDHLGEKSYMLVLREVSALVEMFQSENQN
ncbi:MAG: winged helix-turn-helix transcriptional regulator [Gammaproteobacteria bacterium]|nr:winged helix-turn-helix transcriptional regulator [Gammaproteobacteria bacterium]